MVIFHGYVAVYQRVTPFTESQNCIAILSEHLKLLLHNPFTHTIAILGKGQKVAEDVNWLVVSTPLKNISQLE